MNMHSCLRPFPPSSKTEAPKLDSACDFPMRRILNPNKRHYLYRLRVHGF